MKQHSTEQAVVAARTADTTSADGDRLTGDDLADLRERYAPTQVPPCRLCGGPLAIAAIGGGEPTVYACQDAGYGTGKRYGGDHYSASRWVDRRQGGDSRVMALLEEVEQRRAQESADAVTVTADDTDFPAQANLVWPAEPAHRIGLALYAEPWPPAPEDDGWDALDQWKAALCQRLADVAVHAQAARPTGRGATTHRAACGHSVEVTGSSDPRAQVHVCLDGCPPQASDGAALGTSPDPSGVLVSRTGLGTGPDAGPGTGPSGAGAAHESAGPSR